MRAAAAAAILLTSLTAAAPGAGVDQRALAARILTQLALQPGERVLLLGGTAEPPELIAALRDGVTSAGGTALLRHAGAEARAPLPEFDAVVVLPGASPLSPAYRAAHAALTGGRRAVHFHWRGAEPSPSARAVPGHPLPAPAVIDAAYERAVLRTDCAALGPVMRRFEASLRKSEVRVTTPLGTDLRFRIGNRPVNVQDGDASAARAEKARVRVDRDVELPCGVLRVAPLEESVRGAVVFPPALWAGRPVEGLRLTFDRGQVLELTALSGADATAAELKAAGPAGRAFREFALGFNPHLTVPASAPWIPYYGYGAGVVRLSLGDNTELGGSVGGEYVRWNFFTDATVQVGSEVWVKAGALEPR